MLKEKELNEATLILVTECCEWYPTPDGARNAIVSWLDKVESEGLTEYGEHGYLVRRVVPLNPFDPEEYSFCKYLGENDSKEICAISGKPIDTGPPVESFWEGHPVADSYEASDIYTLGKYYDVSYVVMSDGMYFDNKKNAYRLPPNQMKYPTDWWII